MSVSGNGKGHSACIFWMVLYIVVGIGIIVISLISYQLLTNRYGFTASISLFGITETSKIGIGIGIGLVCGIVCIIFGFLIFIAISKTKITVYQDKVEGVGLSKWFFWGDVRTFSFLYPIEQVSIDLNGGRLVVHGQNTYYGVYVKNGTEIQNALWEAKKGNTPVTGTTS